MNSREFYDWQTLGGGNDVELLIKVLNEHRIDWCMIGGLAVNHWAIEAMATADVDVVIATDKIEAATSALTSVGFVAERFEWSINFKGHSKVSIQVSLDPMYSDFVSTSIPVEVHGIPMRVASLENTLKGKVAAWYDKRRRPSKRQKDFLDIMRLTEAHPRLVVDLPSDIKTELDVRNA